MGKSPAGGGKAEIYVEGINPLNERNKHYLVINVQEPGEGCGIMNLGYNTGIPLRKGNNYKFSCYARRDDNSSESVKIALESVNGTIYGETVIQVSTPGWVRYEATITANATDYSGRLVLTTRSTGIQFVA